MSTPNQWNPQLLTTGQQEEDAPRTAAREAAKHPLLRSIPLRQISTEDESKQMRTGAFSSTS